MFGIVCLGFCGLLLLVGGVVLGVYAWRGLQTASLLKRPLSRAAKLQPGFRKVRGTIAAIGEPLESPVTHQQCVYYRLCIYEDKRTIKGGHDLPGGFFTAFFLFGHLGTFFYRAYEVGSDTRTVYSRRSLVDEEDDIPLVIEDETGFVEVDLRGARIVTSEKARITADDNHPPPAHLEKLLREEHDIDTVDSRGHFKSLHFIEEVLPVGAKVAVVGPVQQLKSGNLCFQKEDAPLLVCERDLGKEVEAARSRATGCMIDSGGALVLGLCCLLGAVFLFVRALLAS